MKNGFLILLIIVGLILYLVGKALEILLLILGASGLIILTVIAAAIFCNGVVILYKSVAGKYSELWDSEWDTPGINCFRTSASAGLVLTTTAYIIIVAILFATHNVTSDLIIIFLGLWVAIIGGAYLGIVGSLVIRELYLVIKWCDQYLKHNQERHFVLPLGTLFGIAAVGLKFWVWVGTEDLMAIGVTALIGLAILVVGWSLANIREWNAWLDH